MGKTALSFDEYLEKTGIAAKLEARAEERMAVNIAKNMINLGHTIESVISATRLDPEKVKAMYVDSGNGQIADWAPIETC